MTEDDKFDSNIGYNGAIGFYVATIHNNSGVKAFAEFETKWEAERWVKSKIAEYSASNQNKPLDLEPGRIEPLDPNLYGKKFDKGKIKAGMVLQYFPRAMLAMAEVGTFGCEKYGDKKDFWDYNWTEVVHAIKRYEDAHARHTLKGYIEERDEETGFLHLAHRAWCAMATLELKLRELEEQDKNG